MARKSLPPPPPDDAAARPAQGSPAPLPVSALSARRDAGPLPPPPATQAAPVRPPVKLPEFRRWHLYALLGAIAAIVAWLWLPGLWTETFHGRPTTEWAQAVGKEKLPKLWPFGAVADFKIDKVDILRPEPGLASVSLTGTATLREALYAPVTARDALGEAGAPLDKLTLARNQARSLRWTGGAALTAPEFTGVTFQKPSAPAGKTATFRYDFQAERVGTQWRVGREISSSLSPSDAFAGALKSNVRDSDPVFLDTEEGKQRLGRLVAGIQSYVEGVEAERTTESERTAQTLVPTRAPTPAPVETPSPARFAAMYKVPAGSAITPSTVSPDGRFGVLGPDFDHDSETAHNQLIELATGRVLTTFEGGAWAEDIEPGHHRVSMHRSLHSAWSADGSCFLWEVGGKWNPWAFDLVRVKDADVEWQVNIYKAIQAEIVQRVKDAVPRKFAAVHAQNAGSDADGFVVDVSNFPRAGFSFPVRLDVTLTSNPKAMPDRPAELNIDATMQAILADDGTMTYARFALADDAPPTNNAVPPPPAAMSTAQRLETADRKLNAVYTQLRGRLDERGKAILKADEMQFLKRLDPVPKTDPRRAEMIERRTDELLRWR